MRLTLTLTLTFLLIAGYCAAQTIGNAVEGEKKFARCAGCHQVGEGARNRVGPILTDVLGRSAGSVAGYRYGDDIIAAGAAGLVWSSELVFEYLENPRTFLRTYLDDSRARSKMSFRLADETDRLDIIAYLGSFETASADQNSEFCVTNQSTETYFFAADNGDGSASGRITATLAPGEKLCNIAVSAKASFVSVFENVDALEGCSRLIAPGLSEGLIRYADFDRCEWSSHSE